MRPLGDRRIWLITAAVGGLLMGATACGSAAPTSPPAAPVVTTVTVTVTAEPLPCPTPTPSAAAADPDPSPTPTSG